MSSKELGGFKLNPVLHLSEVDQMSTRDFWELVKSKLSPQSDSAALRQLNPIYKKGP